MYSYIKCTFKPSLIRKNKMYERQKTNPCKSKRNLRFLRRLSTEGQEISDFSRTKSDVSATRDVSELGKDDRL